MIRRVTPGRSGITLTEILISILIMGVGIVSLATLFPLGLIRLRDASRMTRSAYLTTAAREDMIARNLLNMNTFLNPYYSPWYTTNPSGYYNPWIQDTPGAGVDWPGGATAIGEGLPVAYDPLWRYQTGVYLSTFEARFGDGINGLYPVRSDPNGGASTNASAYGLQRLTNFNPGVPIVGAVPEIFVSPEDLVLQQNNGMGSGGPGTNSPILPDLSISTATPVAGATAVPLVTTDWRYTWMFTGQQSGNGSGESFDGDIVIFENRPFGYDNGTAQGERVVEAVFGYSGVVVPSGGNLGYGASAKRVVLLRWPATQADPDVRVGGWIADVTYERSNAVAIARMLDAPTTGIPAPPSPFAYQRCSWYQVVKRTTPEAAVAFNGDAGTAFRSMTVWVATDLEFYTLLDSTQTPVAPYHVNVALVSPYVVNASSTNIPSR